MRLHRARLAHIDGPHRLVGAAEGQLLVSRIVVEAEAAAARVEALDDDLRGPSRDERVIDIEVEVKLARSIARLRGAERPAAGL